VLLRRASLCCALPVVLVVGFEALTVGVSFGSRWVAASRGRSRTCLCAIVLRVTAVVTVVTVVRSALLRFVSKQLVASLPTLLVVPPARLFFLSIRP
jgi:hypothetical protein